MSKEVIAVNRFFSWVIMCGVFLGACMWIISIMGSAQAQEPPVEDATLAEALELAQAAYVQNNNRNAYLTFDSGQVLHIGDITEIGVDFLCFLVQPPSLPSNVTPSAASRVDRCFPISRVVQVDLTYRVPR